MKTKSYAIIMICSAILIGTVQAQTEIIIDPVFDTYWRDTDGDGFFDTEGNLSGDSLYVEYDYYNPTIQHRIALEFDLSTLGLSESTVIEKAELFIKWGGFSNADGSFVDVLAYQGNGIAEAEDFTPTPVIESWEFTGTEIVNDALVNLDVTVFIQSLINSSQDCAGFTLAGFSEAYMLASFTSKENDREDRRPKLKITYSEAPPAEPSIEETIDFFNQAVEDGTLEASTGGALGRLRLFLMKAYLTSISFCIDRGRINLTCQYLDLTFRACDGERIDWVIGEDAEELNQMIYDLAVSLDCRWTGN